MAATTHHTTTSSGDTRQATSSVKSMSPMPRATLRLLPDARFQPFFWFHRFTFDLR
jgi:hypothetical protein